MINLHAGREEPPLGEDGRFGCPEKKGVEKGVRCGNCNVWIDPCFKGCGQGVGKMGGIRKNERRVGETSFVLHDTIFLLLLLQDGQARPSQCRSQARVERVGVKKGTRS